MPYFRRNSPTPFPIPWFHEPESGPKKRTQLKWLLMSPVAAFDHGHPWQTSLSIRRFDLCPRFWPRQRWRPSRFNCHSMNCRQAMTKRRFTRSGSSVNSPGPPPNFAACCSLRPLDMGERGGGKWRRAGTAAGDCRGFRAPSEYTREMMTFSAVSTSGLSNPTKGFRFSLPMALMV